MTMPKKEVDKVLHDIMNTRDVSYSSLFLYPPKKGGSRNIYRKRRLSTTASLSLSGQLPPLFEV